MDARKWEFRLTSDALAPIALVPTLSDLSQWHVATQVWIDAVLW